jgi:hypothetical protein
MATETRPTRREQRQQRREAERQRQAAAARRARTQKYLIYGVIAVLVIAGGLLAAGPLLGSSSSAAAQGTQYPEQSRDHVNPGQPHAPYSTNPPTSGPHWPDPAAWGIYDQQVPDEAWVHSMEHGGVVIAYNCPDGCPDLVSQLKSVASEYKSKVILTPRPDKNVPYRITLTAWRWMDGFNDFDGARIRAFIAAHKDKGPELFPD